MIDIINNFQAQAPVAAREQLPVGAYPAVVEAVEILTIHGRDGKDSKKLRISFDIADGEYKDYFADDFRSNPYENKKWHGIYEIWLPKHDGSERDGWTISALEKFVGAFEACNPDFRWNWDERRLKGLKIGVNMRREEWWHNGRGGWALRCGALCSYDEALEGKVRPLKDKPLKNSSGSAPGASGGASIGASGGSGSCGTASSPVSAFAELQDDEGELPF